MERMQSTYENLVDFNLSESGVHPLTLAELLEEPSRHDLVLDQRLVYTQSNGTPELRDRVAALYPGATREHVEITNGGSEANYVCLWNLVEPGDEVVMMVPNYMQTWGLARGFGGVVKPWALRERPGSKPRWAPDLDELESLVTPRTKLILLCNPNNPTGARLTAAELDRIVAVAARHGAWVLSDEIYRGAELDGRETDSVWGRYDRAIVNYPSKTAVRAVEVSGAGPVTVRGADGKVIKTQIAYPAKEAGAIIEQGVRRPRPLTHDEMMLARANRGAARGNLATMEAWQRGEMRESTKGKRLQRARGGPEDQTLKGVELGDTFWNPVEW